MFQPDWTVVSQMLLETLTAMLGAKALILDLGAAMIIQYPASTGVEGSSVKPSKNICCAAKHRDDFGWVIVGLKLTNFYTSF